MSGKITELIPELISHSETPLALAFQRQSAVKSPGRSAD
nr:hypothetical protein CDS [Bradyrhizobium sp.]CUT16734.1 hypothetical protein CDS [Bradyrhizobium sp.]